MQSNKRDYFITILLWLVALIFIFAGAGKILNPAQFAVNIDNYRILPYFFVSLLAVVLPWLELLCGLFLISGKLKKGAALTLLLLSLIFLTAISSALIRELDISCGCFTISPEAIRIGYTRLAEDFILLCGVLLIYLKLIKSPN